MRLCKFFKDHMGKTAIVVTIYVGFIGWIQLMGQDWKYWNPIIHGGFMTLIGAGIGAWFGTLKTKEAAIKAAEVAGDETRKAMREQVETQAIEKQRTLVMETKICIDRFYASVDKMINYKDNQHENFVSLSRYTFSDADLTKICQLESLSSEKKKIFIEFHDLLQEAIGTLKRAETDSAFDHFGNISIAFLNLEVHRLILFSGRLDLPPNPISHYIQTERMGGSGEEQTQEDVDARLQKTTFACKKYLEMRLDNLKSIKNNIDQEFSKI